MTKALKIMNIVLPSSAAAVCAIAPLAVYGAEKAYQASHFDVVYDHSLVTLTNPEVVEHEDYKTKIIPIDQTKIVREVEVIIGSTLIDPVDYTFNPETGELFIVGDLINSESLIIIPHLDSEATIEFTKPGEEAITEPTNEFDWEFKYSSDILPESNLVNVSIEKKDGNGTLVFIYPEESVPLFWNDVYNCYCLTVELKFDGTTFESEYESFKVHFNFVSGVSERPVHIVLDDGYKATFSTAP